MPEIHQRALGNMQKLSRAIIGAVLSLPVIGLILALSSVLTNPALIAEADFLHQLRQMLDDTFWPLFGNLDLLFCVGISYGLIEDKKTEVALVTIICFVMFLDASHSWLEHTHRLAEGINDEYYGIGQIQLLGSVVVDMSVFLGIILDCTVTWVYNRISTIELPDALSTYGGAKLALVATTPIVIFYAIAFTWVWPFMTHDVFALTDFMKNTRVAGVFVCGFSEKFLVPTGPYRFIQPPFQLTQINGTLNVDGQVVSGTQTIFLTYIRHPDLTPVMNDVLCFSQQRTTTIFDLAGTSLTLYHTAEPEKKVMAKVILLSTIVTSMLIGITGPIEFTFLFVPPLLWTIHAALIATSQTICGILIVRSWGASGLIESLTYNLSLPISLVHWPSYVLIGTDQFTVYYVIFHTLVVKLNLKTPNREDDENVRLYSKAEYRRKVARPQSVADDIIHGLEDKENILSVDNCFTRLRVAMRGMASINNARLRNTGANGVVRSRNEIQAIYGVKVGQVRSRTSNWLTESQ